MKSIWFEDIVDVMLNIADPNTWWAISSVPWVSSPKINWATSVYNVEAEWWSGIAWWNTDVQWTAWVWSISWTSGSLNLPDWTQLSISSGSTSVNATTYIYVDQTDWTVYSTTSALNAVWENKIMICTAMPVSWKNVIYKSFGNAYQNSLVTGNDIANWTITTGLIQAWAITTNLIATDAVTANEIAANSIWTNELDAWAVTASKIDVSQLSAISANLWSITAWDITGTTITAGSTSGTAVRLNPNNNRIEFYYNWSLVWYMAGWSVDWNGAILLAANFVWMTGRDIFDLKWAKLRIPVWTNLY
jgi:hypothetical protein